MNETIDCIINRVSNKNLELPYPSDEEMQTVYKAAMRAPDHAWLRPTKFIEIKGKGLDKLSKIFEKFAILDMKLENEALINKYKNAPYRAPMILVAMTNKQEHPKVPKIEQMFSTAAAIQNVLISLNSLGYGAIWRSGVFALNSKILKYFNEDENSEIIGYIYIGSPVGIRKKIPDFKIEDYVDIWD
tara:strand:- start:1571 stop:2131 length:561 start_codon:yes stop_codon:yes gene_type:complete